MNEDEYFEAVSMLIALKNSIKRFENNTLLVGINAESTEFVLDRAARVISDALYKMED